MLGALLAWTLIRAIDLGVDSSGGATLAVLVLLLAVVPAFCGAINLAIDRLVYKPLRNAPKLAPLVSAIGVSFVLMNIGQFWAGEADQNVPLVFRNENLLGESSALLLRPV